MKKRIVALLLAGLLSVSVITMASCEKEAERPEGDITTTNKGGGWDTPTSVTWTDVNETVYATAAMSLTAVDGGEPTTVMAMDVLVRVKIGSDGRSVVVKNDKQYYATSRNLTNEDLLGQTFTPCNEKMYVKSAQLNVRLYASQATYSPIKGSYKLNDEVTVIAKGATWCKVQYTATEQYFVYLEYLSPTKNVDPDDLSNYPAFPDGTPTTMYVCLENVSVRKAPSRNASMLGVLTLNTPVTVNASALVGGEMWYKVRVVLPATGGNSPEAVTAYISASCLSETQVAPNAKTLDEMLVIYADFSKTDGVLTRYVTGTTFLRSTPDLISVDVQENNIVETLQKGALVKVVAMAKAADGDGIVWAMIEYAEGTYYFVSSKMLTTDPTGNPAAPTLSELLATYKAFTACTERTVYAQNVVNCKTAPANASDANKKLAKGEAVTVVAEGSPDGLTTWYIFRTQNGELYFAGATLFGNTAPAN